MNFEEIEIYLTPDGLGRAAILRRKDGLFFIHRHWILSEETKKALNIKGGRTNWTDDPPSLATLYGDHHPETGLFGTVEDARRELKSLQGFSHAVLTAQ